MFSKTFSSVFVCLALVAFIGKVHCGNETFGTITPNLVHQEHIYVKSSMLEVKTYLIDYPSKEIVSEKCCPQKAEIIDWIFFFEIV